MLTSSMIESDVDKKKLKARLTAPDIVELMMVIKRLCTVTTHRHSLHQNTSKHTEIGVQRTLKVI